MRRAVAVLLVILLLAVVWMSGSRPGYRAVRTMARLVSRELGADVAKEESANFVLYYEAKDEELVPALLLFLEESLAKLQLVLSDVAPKPIVVRLHASSASMEQAVGGSWGPTLGAYRLGSLHLLSPCAWQPELSVSEALDCYFSDGPVVHELTHLLLDYLLPTPYPVWFSEGMAQYWEMHLQGYVMASVSGDWWLSPDDIAFLERNFAILPEDVAYQESLSLFCFLFEELGAAGMDQLLCGMQQATWAEAMAKIYPGGVDGFEAAWKIWLQRWPAYIGQAA